MPKIHVIIFNLLKLLLLILDKDMLHLIKIVFDFSKSRDESLSFTIAIIILYAIITIFLV